MINVVQQNGTPVYGVIKFVVDTEAEVATLPTTVKTGSMCFVIETSHIYMINSEGEWIKVAIGGGGGFDPEEAYTFDGGVEINA